MCHITAQMFLNPQRMTLVYKGNSFTFLDSSWYELSSFALSASSCKVMILLFATASCGGKTPEQVGKRAKKLASMFREEKCFPVWSLAHLFR